MQTSCFAAILEIFFEKLSRRSMNFVTSLDGQHQSYKREFYCVRVMLAKNRGGSRGRQTSHATNVKIANLIKVLNIRPIVQLIFIMQRHLIIVQYLLSCSGSN